MQRHEAVLELLQGCEQNCRQFIEDSRDGAADLADAGHRTQRQQRGDHRILNQILSFFVG
jgi:hypothetical protein